MKMTEMRLESVPEFPNGNLNVKGPLIHGPRGDNATASRAMAPEGFVSIVDERVDDEG